MNTPFGNADHDGRACDRHDVGAGAPDPGRRPLDARAASGRSRRFVGIELAGKVLGLVGCGNIGSIVAERALGPAHAGPRLRSLPAPTSGPRDLGVERVDLDELLARADVITLHAPLNDATRDLIDADAAGADQARRRASSTARAAGSWTRRRCRRPARPAMSPAPRSTSSPTEPPAATRCSSWRTWSRRRIWAPPPPRPRRTSPCQVAEQMADYLLTGAVMQRAQHARRSPPRRRRS